MSTDADEARAFFQESSLFINNIKPILSYLAPFFPDEEAVIMNVVKYMDVLLAMMAYGNHDFIFHAIHAVHELRRIEFPVWMRTGEPFSMLVPEHRTDARRFFEAVCRIYVPLLLD